MKRIFGNILTLVLSLVLLTVPALTQDRKLMLGAGGGSSGSSTLLTNLQAFYKLADTSDSLGGNTLTNNGSVTFTAGLIGDAASFNGTTQYLSVADNSALSTGEVSFSVAFWAFANDFTDTQVLVSKWGGPGGSSDNEWRIYLDGQVLKSDIHNASGPTIDLDALTNDVQTGEWFLVVFTYDAATDTATLEVNDDGESFTSVGSIPGPPDGGSDLCIGAQHDGDNPANVSVDAVGFWKKLLSDTEQTTYHNSGNGREHPFS